jgi:outer membrane protein assembly factor BamA
MAKLKHLLAAFFFLTQLNGFAQLYAVRYQNDDSLALKTARLQENFPDSNTAAIYIAEIPSLLQASGYLSASVDSVQMDSAAATVFLFLGDKYQWAHLSTTPANASVLQAVHWNEHDFTGPMNFKAVRSLQEDVLNYLEENGHPFGRVFLDSIVIAGQDVSAHLAIEPGPLYRIDSIRVFGDVNISNEFLQRYLDIPNGSLYNQKKLSKISEKLALLSYLEEDRSSDVSMLASGSVLNVHLKPKKTSQINALIGFLPNSSSGQGSQKLRLTVDANVLLRNALGSGETIGLLWQQLQESSPRLNLLFEQPYIFHSAFGMRFSLDMYKRDSSYLNLNMNLGASYHVSDRKTAGIFLQRRQTILNTINTAQVVQTRQLPNDADVSSLNLGVTFAYNSTDYQFNPKAGYDISITTTAGTKTIKKNQQILELNDPGDPAFKFETLYDTIKPKMYQLRAVAALAHYFPTGQQSTFKTAVHTGIYQSVRYFRNELFQIGGYKLLRGFDEESQFVSQYAIGTIEYRYLIGSKSAFFAFVDGGYGKHVLEANPNHTYIGTGLGLSFETQAGVINLAWAVGRRNDLDFNLRQSKLHLGFASYF